MSTGARAVVVGGGVLGLSAALHLLRAGVRECTVLERDGVAQGTSAAGAGFLDTWPLGSPEGEAGAEEVALAEYGIEFYRELGALRPQAPFRQRGSVWIAATERDWPSVERRLVEGPPDARVLEPAEIEAITAGVVRADAVHRGVLRPRSAQISAEKMTRALASVFVEEGGRLAERTPATGFELDGAGRVNAVRTARGGFEADVVVLAAGAWTNALLEPLGAFVAQAPVGLSRIVTGPLGIPADLPLLLLKALDSGLGRAIWIREENGGLLFGANYEAPSRLEYVADGVPERFDQTALDGVLEVRRAVATLTDAIPALGQFDGFRVGHGAPCYTTDGRAIVGPLPGIENLHVLAGCNELGVTYGPGFGRVLAERITAGGSELADAGVWSPERFGPGLDSERAVAEAL